MQRSTFLGRLRLAARFHPHGMRSLAAGSVPVAQLETALIFRTGQQVQNAAGKSVGNRVVEILALSVNVLATDAHQWQRLSPARFTDRPKLHRDRRVPIRIPTDSPLEAQVPKCGVFHDESSCLRLVL